VASQTKQDPKENLNIIQVFHDFMYVSNFQ